jgi:hypothetical protein
MFIAVSVSQLFEAQTFSNFFRFPMIFLCGLFFPIAQLTALLRPLSYALPLTYGVGILHGSILHIPGESDHRFRLRVRADSDPIRSLIPGESARGLPASGGRTSLITGRGKRDAG